VQQVVEDLEGSVRRMLEYYGLEFESACVEFHKTERSVRTASSDQLPQPIFKEGLEQWRHHTVLTDLHHHCCCERATDMQLQ